jgi:uncharacterized protein (DUF362 family)
MTKRTTRRDFLRRAAVGGAAMAALPSAILEGLVAPAAAKTGPSRAKTRVVIARNTAMLSDGEANQAAVRVTLGRAMVALTGTKTEAAAWKSLFKPSDVVGIKINCLCGKTVSTRPEVVDAIIAGLKLAGVKPEQVIVWDRSSTDMARCGFTAGRADSGVLYWADDGKWGGEVKTDSFQMHISTVFSRITALVNAPVVKHHGIPGISGAMKNHYGSIDNAAALHPNSGDPYMADLNALPQIREKTRLIVADALKPQADGGPGRSPRHQWEYYSLLLGTDPVAVDKQIIEIIEARRKETGLSPIAPQTKWLASAAARGVGTDDPAKIDVVRI